MDFINGASIFSLDEFSNLHVHIYFRVLLELHCKDRTHIHPDSYHWKIHITRAPIVTFGTFIEISLSLKHKEDKWATKGNFTYAWFPDLQRPNRVLLSKHNTRKLQISIIFSLLIYS